MITAVTGWTATFFPPVVSRYAFNTIILAITMVDQKLKAAGIHWHILC
jgi:hypothetical protein